MTDEILFIIILAEDRLCLPRPDLRRGEAEVLLRREPAARREAQRDRLRGERHPADVPDLGESTSVVEQSRHPEI